MVISGGSKFGKFVFIGKIHNDSNFSDLVLVVADNEITHFLFSYYAYDKSLRITARTQEHNITSHTSKNNNEATATITNENSNNTYKSLQQILNIILQHIKHKINGQII